MATVHTDFTVYTERDLALILNQVLQKTVHHFSDFFGVGRQVENIPIATSSTTSDTDYKLRTVYFYTKEEGESVENKLLVTCYVESNNTYRLEFSVGAEDFVVAAKQHKVILKYFVDEMEAQHITLETGEDKLMEKAIQVKFKKLHPNAIPFSYTRKNDACMDMYAVESDVLEAGETCIVYTGIAVEIPQGYEGIVRGRSGLASKGIFVHVGTVDYEYRGNVGIIMSNFAGYDFNIERGMRLGQFTVKPVFRCQLIEAEELSETERGTNGYGSSQL